MLEVLRKAGIGNLSEPGKGTSGVRKTESQLDQSNSIALAAPDDSVASDGAFPKDSNLMASQDHSQELEKSELNHGNASQRIQKKNVTFAENTKEPDHEFQSPVQAAKADNEIEKNEAVILNDMKTKTTLGERVLIDSNDLDSSKVPPIIPTNESPEDAELRRQMLQYNMNEVGAIVAEIELDDDGSYTSYSEDEDENGQYDSSIDDDEDEDEHGRRTHSIIDDEYRREMQELERKLNASMIENVGKGPILLPTYASEDTHTEHNSMHESTPKGSKAEKKKGVRFAQDLEVASPPRPNIGKSKSYTSDDPPTRPITEDIIERSHPSKMVSPTMTAKKPSKFKALRTDISNVSQPERNVSSTADPLRKDVSSPAQESEKSVRDANFNLSTTRSKPEPFSKFNQLVDANGYRQVPEGPLGKTHADVLVERPLTSKPGAAIEPDELDPALLHQEVAMEYHRMRNRIIQRNGGFMQSDEPEQEDLAATTEDGDDGGGRKMSRFKAARLARLGK